MSALAVAEWAELADRKQKQKLLKTFILIL
jgi:hypothetical protein